ncbi:hypothetical protein ACIRPK_35425 [Kitasatospora sp. NPDC101801]|uniref:hypothetical protein n=1 Tax=Kitasatospora sp. NPDC101801 TaxID=3364103 RepID=UPI00381E5D5D
MDRPKGRLVWLNNPPVPALLRDLATGNIALTHEAIQQEPSWRTTAYLRDLLMECDVLPRQDRRLLLFRRWLAERLAAITDPEHEQFLRYFAHWHQLRKLRVKADTGPLSVSTASEHRQQITQAGAFLTWLTHRGSTPATATQADLDAWHTENYATRHAAQPFLRWCMDTQRMPRLAIPYQATANPLPLGQHQRLTALRCVLGNETAPLRVRVAAGLVLLFAQPLTRVVRLTTGDVLDDGQQVHLRLGDPPSPLPEPVAALVRGYLRSLPAHVPAVNLSTRWLFPGRRPGQPMNPNSLLGPLRDPGVPAQRARTPPSGISSSRRPPRRSSPRPSATTTRPPPGSSPRLAAPGADTPPGDHTR